MIWHFTGMHGMVQREVSSTADVLWDAHMNIVWGSYGKQSLTVQVSAA